MKTKNEFELGPDRLILLAKPDRFSDDAIDIARRLFGQRLEVFQGRAGEAFPVSPEDEFGNPCVISFLSPWIVPTWLVERSAIAINFHPGSRQYPGIGCYNFAIYEEAKTYGVVCHHMESTVDTGDIVAESLFPMMEDEKVETLKFRSMISMIDLFAQVLELIRTGEALPKADFGWSRKPFTRRELEELCVVEVGMDDDEISRRTRAVTYPGYPGIRYRRPDGTLGPNKIAEGSPIA